MRISTTALLQFTLRVLSSVLGILSLIYFGNVLGAEKIGTYTLAMTVAVWLWVVADPGIGSALIKRISEGEDRQEFFTAALLMIVSIIGAILVLVFLFRSAINSYTGFDASVFVAGLVVSKILFVIFTLTISGYDRVPTSSILRFMERTLRPLLQVGLVVLGMGVTGLLSGYIAASAVGCVLAVLVLPGTIAVPRTEHFRRLLSFAKFSVLKMIRPRAARWTDTAVLGFFVSSSLVGVYEIAWSVALFLILATDSLNKSLFPTLSKMATEDRINRVTAMTESGLAFTGVIVIPGFVGVVLLGRDLLAMFGPEFTQGVVVLPILLTWSVIVSYEHVLRNTMDALDRPDLTFRADLLYVLGNVTGNLILVYFFGLLGAAVATTGAAVVSLAATLWFSESLFDPDYPLGEITKQILSAGIMALVVYPVSLTTGALPRVYVLVPISAGAITYFVSLLAMSTRIRNQVFALAAKPLPIQSE